MQGDGVSEGITYASESLEVHGGDGERRGNRHTNLVLVTLGEVTPCSAGKVRES